MLPVVIVITEDDVMFVAASEPENRLTIGTTDGKVLEKLGGLDYPHGTPWTAAAPCMCRGEFRHSRVEVRQAVGFAR